MINNGIIIEGQAHEIVMDRFVGQANRCSGICSIKDYCDQFKLGCLANDMMRVYDVVEPFRSFHFEKSNKEEKFVEERVLTLPLKKKWFEMVKNGIKKEVYREITDYYRNKFGWLANSYHRYSKVVFSTYTSKGDADRTIEFKNPRIRQDFGKPQWGAEKGELYFVITWDKE